tara:strand:- start:1768 stop:2178 length:411 start_codon:yes stop_codon:yes gene_type:complete
MMKINSFFTIALVFSIIIAPHALMAMNGTGPLYDLRVEGGGGGTFGLSDLIYIILFFVSCGMFNSLSKEGLLIPYWIVGACISYLFLAINWYIKGLSIIPRISFFFEIFPILFYLGLFGFLMLGPISFMAKIKLSK